MFNNVRVSVVTPVVLDITSREFECFVRSNSYWDFVLNFAALKHVRSESDAFTMMRMLNAFTTFCDEVPLADLMPDMSIDQMRFTTDYIRTEYVFVGVAAIVASIIFPFRLLVSIWREVNRK